MNEIKVTVGGKEFSLSGADSVKLFEEAVNAQAEKLAEAQKKIESLEAALQARDGAQGEKGELPDDVVRLVSEAKVYKAKCEEFEKRIRELESGLGVQAQVDERLRLIREAENRIDGFSADGKTNRQIAIEIIRSFDSDYDDSSLSDEQVKLMCDTMLLTERKLSARLANAVGGPKDDGSLAERVRIAKDAIRGRSARLNKNRPHSVHEE